MEASYQAKRSELPGNGDENLYSVYMTQPVTGLEPAAHESYLLSKNSLVTIGVSKFPRVRQRFESFSSRVPGENENNAVHCGNLLTPMVTSEFLFRR